MAPNAIAAAVRRSAPAATLAAGAVAFSGLVVLAAGWGAPEWIFIGVLALALGVAVRSTVAAGRAATMMQGRAARIAGTDPDSVARLAVMEERRRLGEDISARLGHALDEILRQAGLARSASDPRPEISNIRREAATAASDLRRQVGLLRDNRLDGPVGEPPTGAARGVGRGVGRLLGAARHDVLIASAATLVAAVETIGAGLAAGGVVWGSVVVTAAAAATVLGRSVAPETAALAAATLWTGGALAGAPVGSGLWCLASPCVLLWTLLGSRSVRTAVAAGLLVASATWATWRVTPDNAVLTGVVLLTALVGGAVVGRWRTLETHAGADLDERLAHLGAVRRVAVESERSSFARDLHDVVSHAIGVIAMQAAAAEVSWLDDPRGARASLDVVRASAEAARAELGELPGGIRARTGGDVVALADRIRAAGTAVDLTVAGSLPIGLAEVVYRIVQESLTNVVRHGCGATARVRILAREGSAGPEVTVEVEDDGPGPGSGTVRGYGLVGMTERVRQAGGTVTVGQGGGGRGFSVRAVLPVVPEVAS